jgi:hypothetical protein
MRKDFSKEISTISSKAETTPPTGMSKQEVLYSIATKPFDCLTCGQRNVKGYHIHERQSKTRAENCNRGNYK